MNLFLENSPLETLKGDEIFHYCFSYKVNAVKPPIFAKSATVGFGTSKSENGTIPVKIAATKVLWTFIFYSFTSFKFYLSNVRVAAIALSTNERCGCDFIITVNPINDTMSACASDFASVSASSSPARTPRSMVS